MHDGRSLERGGRGCDTKNEHLAAEVGCRVPSLSRAITSLVSYGYLTRERQSGERRRHRTVYRVIFDPEQLSKGIIDQFARGDNRSVIRNGEKVDETVIRAESKNGGNLPLPALQKNLPLKGEKTRASSRYESTSRAELSEEERRALAAQFAQLREDLEAKKLG